MLQTGFLKQRASEMEQSSALFAFQMECAGVGLTEYYSWTGTGLELVALHDRPEGSKLGSYHYIIEVEKEDGITEQELEAIEKIPEVRCLGCFDVMEKQNQ